MNEDLPLPQEPSMEQVSGARVLGATRKSASAYHHETLSAKLFSLNGCNPP